MKSGAGDDPFAEPAVPSDPADTEPGDADEADDTNEADDDAETASSEADAESAGAESEPRTNGSAETTDSGGESDGDDDSAESETDAGTQEIPYKFRRSSVKEGRTQRPIFVREAVEERESEFIRTLEEEVGEKVYKTDAMEAALIVAMDNPDLVAEELREWGYDWE